MDINQEILTDYEDRFRQALRRLLKARKTIFLIRKRGAKAAYVKAFKRALKPVIEEMSAERNRR